ncbi:GerMN domain-containing protein [Bacillus sp. REN10]|uniref:GerMN domain-containing protein n=1 Tax=Bacillus sp. REN10 TaxID=2782541 RepID=UPI00193AEFE8|nr:GerMN domain-containing protein [Bacillus sp. REN10]
MKRFFPFICFVFTFVLVIGCASEKEASRKEKEKQTAVSSRIKWGIGDYLPMVENVKYVYEGKGNEYASYHVMIDYLEKGKIQQRIDNGGTVVASVLQLKDGKLKKVLTRGEAYYRENLLKAKGDEEVLLMEPIAKGTSWKLKDGRMRKITNTAASVYTPSGSYRAIEVITKDKDSQTMDYYAKGIGLVKSVFRSGEMEVSSSLSKIEENVPFVQEVRFFYPNIDAEKLEYKAKKVSFKTNDITRKKLEEAYKQPVEPPLGKVFSKNTKINSLYLNKDGIVYIDLNQEFISEMNAGAGYESMVLQSIANTFGQYYNVEKVILTIDGGLYESGHISMKKGEYLRVQY